MKIPFRQTIRARLVLLVLMVVVPAFLVQAVGAWIDLQQNIATRKQNAGQLVVRAQGRFNSLLESSRSVFAELVRLNEMRNPANCTLVYNALHLASERLAPEATNIGLSDAKGNVYCSVNPIMGLRNIAGESYFQRAIQSSDMALGDYKTNPSTGSPTLNIAYPVLNFDGKIQTVVFISFELNWLESWQKEVDLPSGTALTLVKPGGIILQRYLDGTAEPIQSTTAAQTQWYTALTSGQAESETPDIDGITRLNTLVPLRLGSDTAAYLHLGYPVVEIYTQAQQALAWKLALLLAIFFVALGVAWWGSEILFLHPLKSLMQVVEKVQHGDLTVRAASIPAVGELSGLAQAFDRMAVSLEQRENARLVAQSELENSEARFRAMFENSPVGMGLMGLDRKIIDSNPAMCAMLGISREELLGETPVLVTHPDELPESTRLFQGLISGEIDHYITERRYLRKSGEVFWALVSMSIVRDPNGKPLYLVGVISDIDKLKHTSENLRESEARFRVMYDNAAVGMAMISLDRKIISFNQTAAHMTGYLLDELVDSDPSRISFADDTQIGMDQFREMVTGKIPGFQMEKRFVRKTGEVFWGRVSYSVVPDKDGGPEYLVGIIEDVTEQRLAHEKLAEQEAEYRRTLEQRVEERTHELGETNLRLVNEIEQRVRAEEALAAKAAEVAVTAERTRLARDLHDAVTQTLFSASLIAEVLPDLWAMDVNEAHKSTEELRQLTRGALAEMRTLLLELRPAALTQSRLGDLIRQLCEALIGRARLPINFEVEGDRILPPEVQVAFYRIAQESLNNVFKYARATQVNVHLILSPTGAHLEIRDNGVGFDASVQKSTSLGLRIMRERAEAIGADWNIASKPGAGVTVVVEWNEKPEMKLSVFKQPKRKSYDN